MDVPEATTSTVLVVEDDPVAANALRSLLTHYGYRVLHAGTVARALQLLDEGPQIILLDLNLPDGDGTSVMAALKSRKMTAKVAVVTAVLDADRIRRVKTFGPQFLLQKPLNFLSLLQDLRAIA